MSLQFNPITDVVKELEFENDGGCPKNDPDCLSRNGECHDACVRPEEDAIAKATGGAA